MKNRPRLLPEDRLPSAISTLERQMNELAARLATVASASGAVSSVFGRTGAVVAATNDYTWAQIDKTTSSLADLATRSAAALNSGTLDNARLDTELQALAALTSAADKGIYFTGSGTAGTYDLTSFARTLLDDADASAARTTLGLVIGTNVQAYDTGLAAIAGLTSAADKGIYFTGAGTAGTFDLTSFARTLLDDANAAAVIATLGLDADLATLSLPGSTTISAFGASLIDDAAASNARTTLGLVIGTDVQAYDAELAAIAGLTSADKKGMHFTGSGTAATHDLIYGAWDSFTPTWTASTTNPTVGNGTLAGAYARVGRMIHYRAKWTFGSTSNAGSGLYRSALPVTSAMAANDGINITGYMEDNGVAGYPIIAGRLFDTAQSYIYFVRAAGTVDVIQHNVPFAWGTGDYVSWTATYEAAS